jgi:L-cysteine desulfidase
MTEFITIIVCLVIGAAAGIAIYHFGFQRTLQAIKDDIALIKNKIKPNAG